MKRVFALFLCLVLVFSLWGCSAPSVSPTNNVDSAISQSSSGQSEQVNNAASQAEVSSAPAQTTGKYDPLLDKISITIVDAKKEAVIGDRTQDNYAKKGGEYIAYGSDIVKAADYDKIVVTVQVDNKSEKAISFSSMGWLAVMPDGYKLDNITVDGDIEGQVPSNYSGTSTVNVIVKKSLNLSTFKLNLNLMDYNDEWTAAMGDIFKNGLTEQQYNEKYGDKFVPKPLSFDVTVK